MAILDDIPKQQYFRVPENYFDHLPEKVQAQLNRRPPAQSVPAALRLGLLYLAPVVVVLAFFLFNREAATDAESILNSVETADLISYLQESAVSTEELIEYVDLTTEELKALESDIYNWEIDQEDEFIYLELTEPDHE